MKHHMTYIIACLAIALASLTSQAQEDSLIWHDVRSFGLEGQGWALQDLEAPYDRLPSKAQNIVRGAVWNLSRHSAGLSFRFNTDATDFTIRYSVQNGTLGKDNMPAIGVSGLDLYALTPDQKWRWVTVSRPKSKDIVLEVKGLAKGKRAFMAYLPLYNSVTKMEIGIPSGHVFEPISPRREKPIVFYGTSITHGASASRPGIVHTAILGRSLDLPVINLGFSGNGRMEEEVGALLAEIDPAVYVIDCLPNMTPVEVAERSESLVRKLREARPDAPIVLVEDRSFANAWIMPARKLAHDARRTELVRTYDKLISEGYKGLYYIEGEGLLGDDGEGTTDGSHPSDLGFVRQAAAFEPVLKKALGR